MNPPAVVLVEPQEPGNVGQVARVMANFGLTRLILAGRTRLPLRRDEVAAREEGRRILESLVREPDLASALATFHLSVAVTRRTGKHRPPDLDPEGLPPLLDDLPGGARSALVFGREADGLRADEALLCDRRLAIAAVPKAPSLNLAQAVAVTAYVWYRHARPSAPASGSAAGARAERTVELPAPAGERQRLFNALEKALLDIGFLEGDRKEDTMASLKRLLNRAGLTEREVRLLRGLARKMSRSSSGP